MDEYLYFKNQIYNYPYRHYTYRFNSLATVFTGRSFVVI